MCGRMFPALLVSTALMIARCDEAGSWVQFADAQFDHSRAHCDKGNAEIISDICLK